MLYEAQRWLSKAQNADGSWGYAPGAPGMGEPTLHAVAAGMAPPDAWLETADLGWAELLLGACLPPGHALRSRGIERVLAEKSDTMDETAGSYDGTLVGWSWVQGTFSWAEPTTFAVLSLQRNGHADHPRCQEGVRLLIDRQCADGGWNSGTPDALGAELPGYLYSTGLVLLAVPPGEAADRGFAFLDGVRDTPSTLSVCYAALAKLQHGRDTTWERDWFSKNQSHSGAYATRVDHTALAAHVLHLFENGGLPFHG